LHDIDRELAVVWKQYSFDDPFQLVKKLVISWPNKLSIYSCLQICRNHFQRNLFMWIHNWI